MKTISVTIDGPKAVGKSLLAAKLKALLESEGHKVRLNDNCSNADGKRFVEKRRISIVVNPPPF